MGILNMDINNMNLDDTDYDEDGPDTIILLYYDTIQIFGLTY